MPIVPSRKNEIQAQLERLGSRPAERDAAVARLRLFGARSFLALHAWLPTAGAEARRAALRVLEGASGKQAFELVERLAGDADPSVARAAVETLGSLDGPWVAASLASLLVGSRAAALGATAVRSLLDLQRAGRLEAERLLLELLLDGRAPGTLRLLALPVTEALSGRQLRTLLERLSTDEHKPLARAAQARLAGDPSARAKALIEQLMAAAVPAEAEAALSGMRAHPAAWAALLIERMLQAETTQEQRQRLATGLAACGRGAFGALQAALADAHPEAVRRLAPLLAATGQPAAIPLLHDLIGRLRDRPQSLAAEARAAAHHALAQLDSRVALYDLREQLAERPLRGAALLLAAAARVGDAESALRIVRTAREMPALEAECAAAFRSIADREGLRRGRGALRGLKDEERSTLETLWKPRK